MRSTVRCGWRRMSSAVRGMTIQPASRQLFVAVAVAPPLALVGAVVVAVVLDGDLQVGVAEVGAGEPGAGVVGDVHADVGAGQAGVDQEQAHAGLHGGVDAGADQAQRLAGGHDAAAPGRGEVDERAFRGDDGQAVDLDDGGGVEADVAVDAGDLRNHGAGWHDDVDVDVAVELGYGEVAQQRRGDPHPAERPPEPRPVQQVDGQAGGRRVGDAERLRAERLRDDGSAWHRPIIARTGGPPRKLSTALPTGVGRRVGDGMWR